MGYHGISSNYRTVGDMDISQYLGPRPNPDIIAYSHLADLCWLLAYRPSRTHTVVVVDDLDIGPYQYIVPNSNQVLCRDHAVPANYSVVTDDHHGVRFRKLEKSEILDRAIVANLQHRIFGQPALGIVFDDYPAAAARQVFPCLVTGNQSLNYPPGYGMKPDQMSQP
jgi:hypothetical protein